MSAVITSEQHEQHVAELRKQAREIVDAKRPVYTQGHNDIIRNFKLIASLTRMSIGDVQAVYLAKQVISVMDILTNPNNTDSEKATRFADLLNYLEICYSTVEEGLQHDCI